MLEEEGDIFEGYLLDEVGFVVSFGQIDLLAEGDVGGLGGDLAAVLALELRSTAQIKRANPTSERFATKTEGSGADRASGGGGTLTLR